MTLENKPQEFLFHLIEKTQWEKHKAENSPYFPKSFEKENFIHLSPTLDRLLEIANKYYQDEGSDFVIIELDKNKIQAPRKVLYEEGVPVKKLQETEKDKASKRLWPHLYGGGIFPSDVLREIEIKQNKSKLFQLFDE